MDRKEIGMLAKSKSGHDRNQVYVIICQDDEYVYLSDGRLKTLDKLKKKNRKHIQIICKPQQNILEKLQKGQKLENEEIKRAIKLYHKEISE